MSDLTQELRYAFRLIVNNPGFAAVVIIALALGIGATTAIFSVANSILFRPLPYSDPDRLLVIRETKSPALADFSVSPGNFIAWQSQSSNFEQMAVYRTDSLTLIGDGEPERITACRASAGMNSILGVKPALGRNFTDDEYQPGRAKVAIISYGLWQNRFGGSPGAAGQPITLDGEAYTIVGVMSAGFTFPDRATEAWLPFVFDEKVRDDHFGHYLSAIAKLKPGSTVGAAQSELAGIADRLTQQYAASNAGWNVRVIPMLDYVVRKARSGIYILLGAVACFLLIACANVTSLLLARAAGREKEFAVRSALGAGRLRIIRQLLIESLVLSCIGGGLGLLLSTWGVKAMLLFATPEMPRINDVRVDARALLFTLAVTVLTGISFGLAPGLKAARASLTGSLQQGGRYGHAGGGARIRSVLVVGELALALMLLICGGLLIHSFWRLLQVNPGFNPNHAIAASIQLPAKKYRTDDSKIAFAAEVIKKVSALPGVESVGATDTLPLGGQDKTYFEVMGRSPAPAAETPTTTFELVSPGYFKAMGIPLLRGRLLDNGDIKGAKPVVVINEIMARRYFPNQDPIGQSINMGIDLAKNPKNYRQIVGVVGDVLQDGLDAVATVQTYEPIMQEPSAWISLVVRSPLDLTALGPAIREAVLEIDSEQPVGDIKPLEQTLSESLGPRRLAMGLLGTLALMSLILASIGLYGVMSYSVTERRQEIGIRMALGAERSRVLRYVLKQGMLLTGAGAGLGLAGAFAATRALADLLFQVSPLDILTFGAVSGVLSAVGLLATLIPALKATHVDPIIALRCE